MKDKTRQTDKPEEDPEDGPVAGERLRAARRANDISVRDVAKELHLDEHKVRALEKNEFDTLGAPVFAKGHLRKYAELVGVDTDDVMTDYYQMNRASGVPPVVGPKRRIPRDVNPLPWVIGGGVVILVFAALYWWFAIRSPEPVAAIEPAGLSPFVSSEVDDEPQPESPPPQSAEPEPAPETSLADSPLSETSPEETQSTDLAGVAIDSAGVAPATFAPTPGVPQVELDLAFSGDCWTEVSDASGRRLYYALGQAGSIVTVTGDAPLGVILGDAANVSLTVDGQSWSIPRSAIRGRLARMTISPQ